MASPIGDTVPHFRTAKCIRTNNVPGKIKLKKETYLMRVVLIQNITAVPPPTHPRTSASVH